MRAIEMRSDVYEITKVLRKSKAAYAKGIKVGDKIRLVSSVDTFNVHYAADGKVEKLNEDTNEFELVGSASLNNVGKVFIGDKPIFEAKIVE